MFTRIEIVAVVLVVSVAAGLGLLLTAPASQASAQAPHILSPWTVFAPPEALSFGGYSDGAYGVAIDAQGNVYVTMQFTASVEKFAPDGTRLAIWRPLGAAPHEDAHAIGGLALDSAGNIYVAASVNRRIQKLSSSGQPLALFGGPGTKAGFFASLSNLAVDSQGNIYVADPSAFRVQKLAPNGSPLAIWGAFGMDGSFVSGTPFSLGAPYQFDYPDGVAVDSAGNIYVSDSKNHRIQKLSPSGQPLSQWNTLKASPGQLYGPTGLALDAQGNIYVAGDPFQKLSPNGEHLPLPRITANDRDVVSGVALDAQGSVFVVSGSGILKLPAAGAAAPARSSAPPKFVLNSATTTDAQSVTIDYTVSVADSGQPLKVSVYRSTDPDPHTVTPDDLLGSATLDIPQVTRGEHTATVLQGVALPPNTRLPYIVVVANPDSSVPEDAASVNSTYFQKYLLGAVVHGYAASPVDTLAWVNTMAQQLIAVDRFNDVIAYDWTSDSTLFPDEIAADPHALKIDGEGTVLYNKIVSSAQALLAQNHHQGDVVDIHLIGHSRGAVVVSEALQHFGNPAHPSDPSLAGSFLEVTLLDPHPANAAANILLSSGDTTGDLTSFLQAAGFKGDVVGFQNAIQDPEPVLPDKGILQAAEVYFQHTPVYQDECGAGTGGQITPFLWADFEDHVNLWGEDHIQGANGLNVKPTDLTCAAEAGIGLIGHSELVTYYELKKVEAGGVDRQ